MALSLFKLARHLPPLAPAALALDRVRARRIPEVLAAHSQDITAALASAPPRPDGRIDRLARALLASLRRAEGLGEGLASKLDGAVRSDRGELMDVPGTPELFKRTEMALLDRLNRGLGFYETWAVEVDRALGSSPTRRVYDLAAGAGGFARFVAAQWPAGIAPMEITSSDLEPVYVEQGRRAAERAGLPVRFEVRSALDLRALEGKVDLFVCTQAAHHLTPGMVLQLLAGAIRIAPRGIVLVDVMRSGILALGAALAMSTSFFYFPPVAIDGFQSVRRGYTPAELELLARAAGADLVHARFERPAHCILHARRMH